MSSKLSRGQLFQLAHVCELIKPTGGTFVRSNGDRFPFRRMYKTAREDRR